MTSLVWLRRDLRLKDNPSLAAAAQRGEVLPLFVIDRILWGSRPSPHRAWVAANVLALKDELGDFPILLGDPAEAVARLARESEATSVFLTREFTPYGVRRDKSAAAALDALGRGVDKNGIGSPYIVNPGEVLNQQGSPYKVFTPYSKAWRSIAATRAPQQTPDLDLASYPSDTGAEQMLREAVTEFDLPAAGEAAALARWEEFCEHDLDGYHEVRDMPGVDATSRLSPYLKVGAVHPRTLLTGLWAREDKGAQTFVNELAWREFYADVLAHEPASAWTDLNPSLRTMSYDDDAEFLQAWKRGKTGYPIVDAGMRQLLAEGWMHNRVRMIVASFYAKDLHLWWPAGARHFLDHLIDADIASNSHGWQWTAGTGTDASPYFRVFNPVTQGKKFDPEGEYIRRFVPELAHLPGKQVHEPWEHGGAPGYPAPIVEHAVERDEALRRYKEAKGQAGQSRSR